jgi:ABC-2 type transport system ATP-binding protein
MPLPAVATRALTKRYGRFTAVDALDVEVQEGDLYGFLGPNGSGKTTTMRMILGLVRPTAGEVRIFGRDPGRERIGVLSQVGALVELPAYYPYLSAVENLEVLRLAGGDTPASRIPELLESVGLGPRMQDRVGTYSQGMRQRLGIAMALLSRPKLVFLDEPTNGLDPHGVAHIRRMILELNRKDGTTFVISSHLLHEIEITCTKVGLMKQGRMILQDRLDRVIEKTVKGVRVACSDPVRARELLAGREGLGPAEAEKDGRLFVPCAAGCFGQVNALLVGAGLSVGELSPVRQSLEEIFLAS